MSVRGVRGAITVKSDEPEEILAATRQLLSAIIQANPSLQPDDLASVFFTSTDDLHSTYPALAARQLGWGHVPLLCTQEIPIPGGLPRCIRVLLHWNTGLSQQDIHHIYLEEAVRLRPDLINTTQEVPL
ncbi:MAG: chorismate mutase [Chloroflexi bacterium]|nr:chorismate mutase [Chloroflexota bacterium]